jgi:hypothetical protein
MDEMIWVEILSRHRAVVARHRFSGPEIHIGRGYDNDLVLDDPFVAVQHVRIRRIENGALVAEDIGSANGMFIDRGRDNVERIILDGDRTIRIGHTQLRVRGASHTMPRERPFKPQMRDWPVALVLGVAILGLEALSLWLSETNSPKLSRYLPPLLEFPAYILTWSAVWAVLCRIFSGQARFERNLLIALVGWLALWVYDVFAKAVGFALSWYPVASYEYVIIYGGLAAICFCHLREIGPSRLGLKAGVVTALAGTIIAAQALIQIETSADHREQDYAHRLLPPAFRLAPLHSESAFFADVGRLKDKLDQDRATSASSEDSSADPDD